MTQRVDLYLIQGASFSDIAEFCLRLTDKIFHAGHLVHILTNAPHESEVIDRLLWESNKVSFLPHAIKLANTASNEEANTPIGISHASPADYLPEKRDTLVSYQTALTSIPDGFARWAIIIPNAEDDLKRARELYRILKSNGIVVNSHDMRR